MDDDEVLRVGRTAAELAQDTVERIARVGLPRFRKHVPRAAERVVRLLEPELAEVARDRRLRDVTARLGESAEELELAADAFAGHDARDQPLPLRLRPRDLLHSGG